MGLDMYLSATKYVKDWEHNYPDGVIPDDTPAKVIESTLRVAMPAKSVTFEAGYWRKANAIHNWFVKNVQGGEDECVEHGVAPKQMQELLDLVTRLLESRSVKDASELLPPMSGFFFGSINIDDWYWQDLEDTKAILTRALAMHEADDSLYFSYQSSW